MSLQARLRIVWLMARPVYDLCRHGVGLGRYLAASHAALLEQVESNGNVTAM